MTARAGGRPRRFFDHVEPVSPTPESVLITGASSGIGRATALELAGRGACLVLVARGEEPLDDTADEARAAGAAEVLVRPADVTDEDAIQAAVDAAVQAFGRLDAVVHAAQVMAYGTIEEVPRDVYETVVDVAVHGTANLARVGAAAVPEAGRRAPRRRQLAARLTSPHRCMGSYVAAKWGQLGLIRVLQQETRDEPGISVSAVQPGGVDTPIYFQAASWTGSTGRPPPPVYSPQRVARAVLVHRWTGRAASSRRGSSTR